MAGKYIINTLKKSTALNGVTLVCCFSREIYVPIFFRALKQMDLPRSDIHLLVYDNTQDPVLLNSLQLEIEKIFTDYKSIRLYKSYLKGRGSISGSGNEQFNRSKLYNIWHMWKTLFKTRGGMIYTDSFFQLEDDTIAPKNAYKRLFSILNNDSHVAMATAIETGRQPKPWSAVSVGVHKLKMKGFKLLVKHSFGPDAKGIVECDGCGVYCFAARTKAFQTGFNGYDPAKLFTPFFALDVVFTWNIKKHGYKLLADFSLWCSHLEASAGRIIAFSKDQAVETLTYWHKKANNYVHGLEIKKPGQKMRKYGVKKFAETFDLPST